MTLVRWLAALGAVIGIYLSALLCTFLIGVNRIEGDIARVRTEQAEFDKRLDELQETAFNLNARRAEQQRVRERQADVDSELEELRRDQIETLLGQELPDDVTVTSIDPAGQ